MLLRRVIPLPIQAAFSASSDHDELSAYTATPGGSCSTIDATITASGGSGSYSYSWPASGGGITTSAPSSNVTHWNYTGHGIASTATFTFTCTVTDLVSGHVNYVSVHVRMQAGGEPP